MANANLAFEVPEGYLVEGGAGVFSGFDAPTFDAPVGSIYLRTDATRYTKTSSGTGAGTWTLEVGSVPTNTGMGMRILPDTEIHTIETNYESVVTRRAYIYGRLILKGRLSVLF